MNNTDCPRNGLAKLSIFLQFFAVGSRPTGQQINFNLLGSFFLHKVINSMSFRLSTFPSQTLHKKNSERMFYWSALGHCRIQTDSNFTYKNHLWLTWKSWSVETWQNILLYSNLSDTMRTNLLNWCHLVSISKNIVFYAFLVVRIY